MGTPASSEAQSAASPASVAPSTRGTASASPRAMICGAYRAGVFALAAARARSARASSSSDRSANAAATAGGCSFATPQIGIGWPRSSKEPSRVACAGGCHAPGRRQSSDNIAAPGSPSKGAPARSHRNCNRSASRSASSSMPSRTRFAARRRRAVRLANDGSTNRCCSPAADRADAIKALGSMPVPSTRRSASSRSLMPASSAACFASYCARHDSISLEHGEVSDFAGSVTLSEGCGRVADSAWSHTVWRAAMFGWQKGRGRLKPSSSSTLVCEQKWVAAAPAHRPPRPRTLAPTK